MPQDLWFALRQLARHPLFSLIIVLTLGLGIGANTAIFSVVHGVLFRPLPYQDADRLVRVYSERDGERWTVSPPDLTDWRRDNTVFTDVAGLATTSFAVTGDGAAEQVLAAEISPEFFEVLGIPPLGGRGFLAEEATPGRDRVALLSEEFAARRFGRAEQALGRTLVLDGESYEIVGIAAAGIDAPRNSQIWVPLAFTERDLTTQRGAHYVNVYARLRPGITVEAAGTQMRTIAARLASQYPESNTNWSATVVDLRESLVEGVERALLALLGAVGFVLLIACANVANLLLTRAVGRTRETAVRVALGAGRRRLARNVLAESLFLAVLGGLLGVGLASWGVALLLDLQPGDVPRLDAVRIDGTVLAFTALATVATGLVFGLIPALQTASRSNLSAVLAGGRSATGGPAATRTRRVLVVAETALAVVLVTGGGLLIRSFANLMATDPGFRPDGLLVFDLSLPESRYGTPDRNETFIDELMTQLEALPGAERVGAVFGLPLSGFGYSISVSTLDGRELPAAEQDRRSVQVRVVTPAFLETLGIPLIRGRGIEPGDRTDTEPVVVVSEAAAALLWPGEDPIGRHFTIGTGLGLGRGRVGGRVVGVAGNVLDVAVAAPPQPLIYVAHHQFPVEFMSVAIRTAGDPVGLAGPARAVVAALDPEVPIYEIGTMERLVDESVARNRFYMIAMAIFGGVALLLASVGLYGVISHGVAARRRDIGIRLALGAPVRGLLSHVVSDGLRLAAIGLAMGLVGGWWASGLLRGLLYQVDRLDPMTLAGVAALLLGIAGLASWMPARRVTAVHPVEALRHE